MCYTSFAKKISSSFPLDSDFRNQKSTILYNFNFFFISKNLCFRLLAASLSCLVLENKNLYWFQLAVPFYRRKTIYQKLTATIAIHSSIMYFISLKLLHVCMIGKSRWNVWNEQANTLCSTESVQTLYYKGKTVF